MNIVIFGAGYFAELLSYYILQNKTNKILAFTVDNRCLCSNTLQGGGQIIPFEKIENNFKTTEVSIIPAVGYSKMQLRSKIFEKIKSKGYKIPNIICNGAILDSSVEIGEGNIIMPGTIIEPFVKIGNNNVFWSGSHICHDAIIEGHCFFAAESVVGGRTKVGESTFIGFNSTVIHDLQIGANDIIGAGSFVNKSTKPNSKYYGVPAKKKGTMPPEGWSIK